VINYSELRQAGLLSGTIKDATAKRRHRDKLALATAPDGGYVAIPLGTADSARVNSLARAERPRIQRWIGARGLRPRPSPSLLYRLKSGRSWGISEINCGRYSSRCTYPMIDYEPWVKSYGYTTATHLIATIWNTRYRYRAPRGWVFGRDDLGIYVVRVRKRGAVYRYHLTSDDVRGGVAAIRAAGIRHEDEQRAAKRAAIAARRLAEAIASRDPNAAFDSAIAQGLDPDSYMFMYSTERRDYFKHVATGEYVNFSNDLHPCSEVRKHGNER